MYVVYINLLYFLSIFLFTYNKNLLSQKKGILIITAKGFINVIFDASTQLCDPSTQLGDTSNFTSKYSSIFR